jgi:hypothetical protein
MMNFVDMFVEVFRVKKPVDEVEAYLVDASVG